MPTDLRAVSARKRKAQAQTKTNITIITIVLVYFIICLSMLVLLFADQSFSKAAIELMGFFKVSAAQNLRLLYPRKQTLPSATVISPNIRSSPST